MTSSKLPITACWIAAATLAALSADPVRAQAAYPSAKAIHMIIPLAAGSAVDNGARVLTQRMGTELGQSFYIENLPAPRD